ncbi:protein TsetseEP-like [Episyrphus balteatus]|uniref:protein TsetseEP-like n=1 Tax=Episyrphus balteatus TaxID=286459 RepID=UPI0024852D72|nr:protein TsetseEP-like [Episyrphus balteatus]
MRTILWIFITLSVVHANKSEEDDQSPKNNSVHLDCFDVFIPLIDRLSNEAKNASDNCVNTANADKERELTSIKNTRTELHSEVKRIKETLTHCSSRSDHLGYFECLNGIVEVDRKIVADIAVKSSQYSTKVKQIEEQEIKCFRNSVL